MQSDPNKRTPPPAIPHRRYRHTRSQHAKAAIPAWVDATTNDRKTTLLRPCPRHTIGKAKPCPRPGDGKTPPQHVRTHAPAQYHHITNLPRVGVGAVRTKGATQPQNTKQRYPTARCLPGVGVGAMRTKSTTQPQNTKQRYPTARCTRTAAPARWNPHPTSVIPHATSATPTLNKAKILQHHHHCSGKRVLPQPHRTKRTRLAPRTAPNAQNMVAPHTTSTQKWHQRDLICMGHPAT